MDDRRLHVHRHHRLVRPIAVGGEELQGISGLANLAEQHDVLVFPIDPNRLFRIQPLQVVGIVDQRRAEVARLLAHLLQFLSEVFFRRFGLGGRLRRRLLLRFRVRFRLRLGGQLGGRSRFWPCLRWFAGLFSADGQPLSSTAIANAPAVARRPLRLAMVDILMILTFPNARRECGKEAAAALLCRPVLRMIE